MKFIKLVLDWVSFICDDCVFFDCKIFCWIVQVFEFVMVMIRGKYMLVFGDDEYVKLWIKVVGCMVLLILYFDIMGVRLNVVVQVEKQCMEMFISQMK